MICQRCHQPLWDDVAFNRAMETYGHPQRRLACINAHSHMVGVAAAAPKAAVRHRGGAVRSSTLLVFQRHDGALAVGMRTVRAHIKDCVGVLSSLYVGKVEGEKSFAVRAKNALYYPPEIYWVPIRDRDGKPMTAPTGIADKAVRFMTRMGPMSAIKTREFVMGAVIDFPLLVLTQPSGKLVVSEADLKTIFMYGGTHGYGPERSDGEGRYAFSMAQGDA
jgi:hypothetical protein